MKPTSVQPDLPCREGGNCLLRPAAQRRDDRPAVSARCGDHAGRRDALRGTAAPAAAEDCGGPSPRLIGRNPGRRRTRARPGCQR